MRKLFCIALLSTFLPAGARGAAGEQTEYYAVFIDGKKVGSAKQVRKVADKKVTHVESAELTIARGAVSVTMRQSQTSFETPDGKPLGFEDVQELGTTRQSTKGAVGADGKVRVTTVTLGQQRSRTFDWPKGAIMSEGLRLLAIGKGMRKGTSYPVKVFVPSMLQAVDGSVAVGPTGKVDLLGRVVVLTEVTTRLRTGLGEITTTSYVDEKLAPQKTVTSVMGMKLEMIACEKAFAQSKNDILDILDKSVLASPTLAGDLHRATGAIYHLQPTGKGPLGGVVATDSQTVRAGKDGGLIVTVRPVKAPSGGKFPYSGKDKSIAAAAKPARYLQSDRKEIIDLARKAVGKTKDAAVAAKRIETFVGEYVTTKSLSVGYASAAEVALSREGDCTEHAVLAAAMCRAVGIPARVVIGYLYTPKFGKYSHVFIGHAWVEAHVAGRWVGLDAAHGGTGAGHLAQAVGDGDPAHFANLLTSLGRIKIAKLTVEQ